MRNEVTSMDYLDGVEISPSAHVAKSAVILGKVRVGADCTILYNAAVRSNTGAIVEIGEGSNIQDGACLHVDVNEHTRLGRHVTVGHGAIVHGCDIGDCCLVGMGATVINHAQIGDHCLIGAGALVTGTANIEPGMLVLGSPARAVRPLTDAEIVSLEAAAQEYMQTGKELESLGLLLPGSKYDPLAC